MNITDIRKALHSGGYDARLTALYGADRLEARRDRFARAADEFLSLYGDLPDAALFSVPGRSEISGNHTDHQHGRVIAASIDLDIIAVAAKCEAPEIRVKSEGFDEDVVSLASLSPDGVKKFDSSAIVAGMCDGFAKRGFAFGGFKAYTTSNVLKGSGLSSSAAFEVMCGNILNHFYNGGRVPAPEIAKTAQYAENVFFGKPCGLMDQTACAVGGFVAIDFADPTAPVIEKLGFDLTKAGYALCIVNTGGNHADLNDDYASIPAEMKSVAKQFGMEFLRGLRVSDILARLPELREKCGDRALLRALHFIDENELVGRQTEALRRGDTEAFLAGEIASGRSSQTRLQNVFTTKNVSEQGISLALAVAEELLAGTKSAWRVHGGGFAGTIQAFVPLDRAEAFTRGMDAAFGKGAAVVLHVRADGAVRL